MSTKLAIEQRFKAYADEKFSPAKLKVAAREVAQKEIELIRNRTWKEGIDYNGRPFRTHSGGYLTWKQAFIKRGYKYLRGRGKRQRLVSAKPTAFAANKATDFIRLSGRLFTDMMVKSYSMTRVGKDWKVRYTLDFRTARSRKIAEYHNESGAGKAKTLRRFWGAAERDKDVRALKRALNEALGLSGRPR